MNIYVCIKQVPDTETKIKISADGNGIDTSGVKWIISPYDEFAIEEALRLRDKNAGSFVSILSAGPARVTEAIRTALAMGADNGIHVDIPETSDSHLTAKALSEALKKETKVDLIFVGKEAIDDGASQVGPLIADFLGLPCVTVVIQVDYANLNQGKLRCKREVEGGAFEMIEISMPALIAAQKGMNEPRYASLPNIMKAKKKEIKILGFKDLGLSSADQKIKLKSFQLPPPKQQGRKLSGDPAAQVKELVRLLHEEAKVV